MLCSRWCVQLIKTHWCLKKPSILIAVKYQVFTQIAAKMSAMFLSLPVKACLQQLSAVCSCLQKCSGKEKKGCTCTGEEKRNFEDNKVKQQNVDLCSFFFLCPKLVTVLLFTDSSLLNFHAELENVLWESCTHAFSCI